MSISTSKNDFYHFQMYFHFFMIFWICYEGRLPYAKGNELYFWGYEIKVKI